MKNEKKQTAVDYIFSQLPAEYGTTRSAFDVYQQAKEMEKQQIIDAHLCGQNSNEELDGQTEIEYYEQTYGGNDQ
jgi:hypothetical protein